MDVMSTSYEEQLAALEELHRKEIAARESAIAEYENELKNLTDKYESALEDLSRTKEDDIKEFVRDFETHPESLATKIIEQFGFIYVE